MLPITQRQFSWVRNVDPCPNTSVGLSANEEFTQFGQSSQVRNNEDRYFNGCQRNLQLCMVLDGHNGEKAVEYAEMSLSAQLLANEITGGQEEVSEVIQKVFRETEKCFFLGMDDPIGRRLALKAEINQRAVTSHDAQLYYPQQVQEIGRLDAQIKGGTTVVLSLVCRNHLYTANVGDSRAVLCQEQDNGQMIASQLSDDHNVFNPAEQERLSRMGLDVNTLLLHRRLGPFQVTRSIGDYAIKGGYQEIDVLRPAREEPGSCIPFINGPWDITVLKRAFLILMSDGLYEAYCACINTRNPIELHKSLAELVAEEMRIHTRMARVAQAVINRVKEQYKEIHRKDPKGGRLDDMTLIIQNFSYPMNDLTLTADHVNASFSRPETSSVLSPGGGGGGGGGVFVEERHLHETSPQSEDRTSPQELPSRENPVGISSITKGVSQMEIKPNDGVGQRLSYQEQNEQSHSENNSTVELTKEQVDSGTYIKPYISFPRDFPFDLGLDDL